MGEIRQRAGGLFRRASHGKGRPGCRRPACACGHGPSTASGSAAGTGAGAKVRTAYCGGSSFGAGGAGTGRMESRKVSRFPISVLEERGVPKPPGFSRGGAACSRKVFASMV